MMTFRTILQNRSSHDVGLMARRGDEWESIELRPGIGIMSDEATTEWKPVFKVHRDDAEAFNLTLYSGTNLLIDHEGLPDAWRGRIGIEAIIVPVEGRTNFFGGRPRGARPDPGAFWNGRAYAARVMPFGLFAGFVEGESAEEATAKALELARSLELEGPPPQPKMVGAGYTAEVVVNHRVVGTVYGVNDSTAAHLALSARMRHVLERRAQRRTTTMAFGVGVGLAALGAAAVALAARGASDDPKR